MIWLLLLAQTPIDSIHAEVARAPAPVQAFIVRRATCNHWSGEEPYDDERARQIARALGSLKCNRIEADELALRRRYAAHADLIALIDRTSEIEGW